MSVADAIERERERIEGAHLGRYIVALHYDVPPLAPPRLDELLTFAVRFKLSRELSVPIQRVKCRRALICGKVRRRNIPVPIKPIATEAGHIFACSAPVPVAKSRFIIRYKYDMYYAERGPRGFSLREEFTELPRFAVFRTTSAVPGADTRRGEHKLSASAVEATQFATHAYFAVCNPGLVREYLLLLRDSFVGIGKRRRGLLSDVEVARAGKHEFDELFVYVLTEGGRERVLHREIPAALARRFAWRYEVRAVKGVRPPYAMTRMSVLDAGSVAC